MVINITEKAYNKFIDGICRIENSPVRDSGADFWDIFSQKEADISGNTVFMNFLKNIDTKIPE